MITVLGLALAVAGLLIARAQGGSNLATVLFFGGLALFVVGLLT